MSERFVPGDPSRWPYNGDLRAANTALLVIDMQIDFCGPGGYVEAVSLGVCQTRTP
jgi:hypothetical protein